MKAKNLTIGIFVAMLLLIGFLLIGNSQSPTGNVVLSDSELSGDPDKVTIYFFWGDGCPHCDNQKPYLEEWKYKYSDNIEVKMFETWKNRDNVKLFQQVASAYGVQAQGVPTTFIGQRHWVGFSSAMAVEMEKYIESCIENKCEDPLVK